MLGPYFSKNGTLLPIEQALARLDDLSITYGFGVYETLKVRHGLLYFGEHHEDRLFHSAQIIGLTHTLQHGQVQKALWDLADGNNLQDANLKVLLYGGKTPEAAQLFILALNPLFPERKLYKQGGFAVTFTGERLFPQAKTLNMLLSSLAFQKAQEQGAYDALFVDRQGQVTEGTRTNFFVSDGQRILSAPRDQVLEGVTKLTLLETLQAEGIPYEEADLPLETLGRWAGCFLSSTSTKVLPLTRIDGLSFGIPPLFLRIKEAYDRYLDEYARQLNLSRPSPIHGSQPLA